MGGYHRHRFKSENGHAFSVVVIPEIGGANLQMGRTIRQDPLNPLHASSLRLWDQDKAVPRDFGHQRRSRHVTRPIMFASPPNQICRVAWSNAMCRMVFARSAGMTTVSVKRASRDRTRRAGWAADQSRPPMRPRSSSVMPYGREAAPEGNANSSIFPLVGSSRPRNPRVIAIPDDVSRVIAMRRGRVRSLGNGYALNCRSPDRSCRSCWCRTGRTMGGRGNRAGCRTGVSRVPSSTAVSCLLLRQPADDSRALRGEPCVTVPIERHRVRIAHRCVGHQVRRELPRRRVEPHDAAVRIAGEPRMPFASTTRSCGLVPASIS